MKVIRLFAIFALCLFAATVALNPPAILAQEEEAGIAAAPDPEEPSLKITAKRSVGDRSRYKAVAQISGDMSLPGSEQATPVDLTLEMVVTYSVVRPVTPGTTEVLLNTESASVIIGGSKIQAPAAPQSMITLDHSGKIINISGMDRIEGLSGTNISSLMALMLAVFPAEEIKPGKEWTSEAQVFGDKKLKVKYALIGSEKVGEQETARIKQVFELGPSGSQEVAAAGGSSARGEAISNFFLANGRLVKSEAQVRIVANKQGSAASMDANVKLDVNLLPD